MPWFFLEMPGDGITDLADDERLRLFAAMIANQVEHAGAGNHGVLDCRQVQCPICNAPGFSGGMGAWIHTCGAEYLGDGEIGTPCPKTKPWSGTAQDGDI